MRRALGLAAAAIVLALPAGASATWSIVGVDPVTQEVGVAVASCVEAPFGTTILPQVAGVVPGVGALAAQAAFSQTTRDEAVMLLAAGNSPQDVIDMVVAGDFMSASRQYGVVTLDGQSAGFTGEGASDWAGDVQGMNVAAQGNILYGPEVVDDAFAAFEAEAPSCPFTLADRLMIALEAGAAQGGDNRCSEEQTALAAVLIVARPDDAIESPYIDLRIPSEPQGGENPVVLLRAAYDVWREANPPDDSECGGGSSGTGSHSGEPESSSGSSGGAANDETTSNGSSSDAATSSPASTTGVAAESSGTGEQPGLVGTEESGGCGCTAPWRGASGWVSPLFLALRRRRAKP